MGISISSRLIGGTAARGGGCGGGGGVSVLTARMLRKGKLAAAELAKCRTLFERLLL
jgi:hypothetical protein